MSPETTEVLTVIDKIVGWITPILVAIVGLAVYIYRDKIKTLSKDVEQSEIRLEKMINTETQNRKEDTQVLLSKMNEIENNHKNTVFELQHAFKEGIKEEREFRNDIMVAHSNHIEKIFGKLDDLSISIGKLGQKVESHIENQERICKINHPHTIK